MNARAFFAMVRKDLVLFFQDRRAVLLSFAAPILIGAFFGFLTGGGGGDNAKIPVVVADQDQSAISREITAKLKADTALEVTAAATPEAAREVVRRGKAPAALVIPKGFGDAAVKAFFGQEAKPELLLLHDPSHTGESAMIRGILTQHVMETVSREAFSGPQGRLAAEDALTKVSADPNLPATDRKVLSDLLKSVVAWQDRSSEPSQKGASSGPAGGLTVPFTARDEAVTGREGVVYNGYSHSFAGMAIQFILMTAVDFGVAILMERRLGLWKRLLAAPVSRSSILMGRAFSGAVISGTIFAVCMGVGMVVFGIRVLGSWTGFAAIGVVYALMASAFGLMLAALGRTPEATRGLAIFAVLLLVMLGGGWVPAFFFPAWLQKATLIFPTRWAMDALDAVTWRGLGLEAALPAVLVLALFTALFALVALWRFRWEE